MSIPQYLPAARCREGDATLKIDKIYKEKSTKTLY